MYSGSKSLSSAKLYNSNSAGNLPDMLAEIKWNIDWMLSMQDPTDGGVFHKQTSLQFPGFVMPEADTATQYIIGIGAAPFKGTCSKAGFAAVAAIAARVFASYDQEYATQALEAAEMAWNWALQNPTAYFSSNPSEVGNGRVQRQ